MSRLFYPERGTNTQDVVDGVFSFVTNAGSDPTATYTSSTLRGYNLVTSITHTGTGTYLLTLNNVFRWVACISGSVQDDGSADRSLRFGTISNEGGTSAITVVVYTYVGASVADIASARCFINIKLKDSKAGF